MSDARYQIKIKRRASGRQEPYWQEFIHEGDPHISVAEFLRGTEVEWECGCLLQKCGACAMRINGRPALACGSFLDDEKKTGPILIEPLSKFPVVRDLVVDRSLIAGSVREMKLWLEDAAQLRPETHQVRYDSAKCLQCGCCLEICPNFAPGRRFAGALGAVNAYRLLDESRGKAHGEEMKKEYLSHYYSGCGQSLACHDICPIDLPVEEMLIRSNAMAIWGR